MKIKIIVWQQILFLFCKCPSVCPSIYFVRLSIQLNISININVPKGKFVECHHFVMSVCCSYSLFQPWWWWWCCCCCYYCCCWLWCQWCGCSCSCWCCCWCCLQHMVHLYISSSFFSTLYFYMRMAKLRVNIFTTPLIYFLVFYCGSI